MKTVTIESVNYKIVEYTKKCKYIKTMLFTFRIDNKDYPVLITNLEKSIFHFTVPFCNKPFGISSFKYLNEKSKFYFNKPHSCAILILVCAYTTN